MIMEEFRRSHRLLNLLILVCVFTLSWIRVSDAWNIWAYNTTWAPDPKDAVNRKLQWETVWSQINFRGKSQPPRPRRGHSLHLIKTDPRSDYKGHTYIVLFGGRDNDQSTTHIPKTYNVKSVNGTIVFTTYDQKPVNPCNDPHNYYYSKEERVGCDYNSTSTVDIGLVYNDVWAYRICPQDTATHRGERDFDNPCRESGWELWHSGALQGGCAIELGIEVCTVPSERFNHGSVLFDDGCLYVYGGFSQRCQDYCDDIWFFDIYLKSWRQVYMAGQLAKFYTDSFFSDTIYYNKTDIPITNTTSKFAGPGARWRHTMAASLAYTASDGTQRQKVAIFGGHRLWHGFSPENSQDNNWSNFTTRPIGGYLNDLWLYTKYLDFSFPGATYKANNGKWKYQKVREQCFVTPGLSWESRNDVTCTTIVPEGRGGHGSAFDDDRNRVWIFGGYSTYFPYLSTDGQGSGKGVIAVGFGGFVPYPGYDYFRNDLWYFDFKKKLWIEIEVAADSPIPEPRMDSVFLLLGDVIFVHGGYADNHIFSDTWYFNISTSRWLKKEAFVRPVYSKNCTDDEKYIKQTKKCIHLDWPREVLRNSSYPFNILPYSQQPYYWPDSDTLPIYFPIFPQHGTQKIKHDTLNLSRQAPDGTPLVPYAATGMRQFAKSFIYGFNGTHNATLYEYCTSVFGEPTRGKVTDGQAGRASGPIQIAQPRRQKPGWDGCRDRADGRTDLPLGLQSVQPLPTFGHRAVFHKNTTEIFMYGGMSYFSDQPKSLSTSYNMFVQQEMWYYHLNHCLNNCTFHGECIYGFCYCDVGYYGVDCSNTSCPGTFCYYDEITHEQICTHACQAGYNHTDDDIYVQDIAKLPCTLDHLGESNGICDGFGSTMCAPPFIGEDCSIKDCKANCSFNGWCSVEFPVSRCVCQPGYFGDICQYKICLNNCSYPNGVCNSTSGLCSCNMMYSPYNNSREYYPWDGEDCSYLFAYEAGNRFLVPWATTWSSLCTVLMLIWSISMMLMYMMEYDNVMIPVESSSSGSENGRGMGTWMDDPPNQMTT